MTTVDLLQEHNARQRARMRREHVAASLPLQQQHGRGPQQQLAEVGEAAARSRARSAGVSTSANETRAGSTAASSASETRCTARSSEAATDASLFILQIQRKSHSY